MTIKRFKFLANYEDANKSTGEAEYVLASDYDQLVRRLHPLLAEVNTQLNHAMRLKRKPRRLLNSLLRQRGHLEAMGAKGE
jgi:hypothetical protein